MDRKEITGFLIDCKPNDFMAYKDYGDQGTTVVSSDGKKYRFSVEQLEKGHKLMSEEIMKLTLAEAAAKEPARPAPKRKPATKKKTTPRKKPAPKNA